MGAKSAIGSPLPVRGMTALIWGCGVLANRLFVWLDHARYVIITKRLMAYAGPSSNGRTLVFGTSYVGSNPAGPAIYLRTKPPSGGFFVALQVYALISVRMRFILGGVRLIATISQSQKTKITSFLQLFCDWGLPFAPAKRKESQYSHFAALSDLNLRSGELATIPNRKNVAIRSDFLFLGLMGRPQDGAGGVGYPTAC